MPGFFDDKQILSARYTSEAHDTVMVEMVDPQNAKQAVDYPLGIQDINHPDVQSLVDAGWDFERIQKETLEYNQAERQHFKEVLQYIATEEAKENEQVYKAKIAELEQKAGIDMADIVPSVVNSTDADVLFQAKLAAFELDKVQASKSKTLKNDIREATSLIQLFGLLAKVYK